MRQNPDDGPRRQMIEVTVAGLTDPSPVVRALSSRQLADPNLPPKYVADALARAIRLADSRTPLADVRAWVGALQPLGPRGPEAASALLAQLRPDAPLARDAAIRACLLGGLGRVGVPAALIPATLPRIHDALRSNAPALFAAAASVAGAIGPKCGEAVARLLLPALAPDSRNDTVLDALFGPVPATDRAARPGHAGITSPRREAVQALGRLGAAGRMAIPALQRAARDASSRDAERREQGLFALTALEAMGPVARTAFDAEWARLAKAGRTRVGQPVPPLSFTDWQGKARSLADWRGSTVLVLFVDTHCPCVAAYDGRIEAIRRQYGPRGLRTLFVFANPNDEDDDIFHWMEKRVGPDLVGARDARAKMTRAFAAQVASETCVVDKNGVLRYRGRIDDSIYDPNAVRERSLENALRAVLAGKPVARPETTALGCALPNTD